MSLGATGALAALSGLLLAAAVLLAWRRHDRVPVTAAAPAAPRGEPERGMLVRLRPALVVIVLVGVWMFFGGVVGLVVAPIAGVVAWRVLGAVESPAVVRRREQLADDLPAGVDLFVGALESGASTPFALRLVGEALPGPLQEELAPGLARIELGADPGEVWRELAEHPQLGPLGRALHRAHSSGASVVLAGRRLAEEIRQRQRADHEAVARSVSTKAAAPMGVCFLPAFVLLGIVPLVAGLMGALRLG